MNQKRMILTKINRANLIPLLVSVMLLLTPLANMASAQVMDYELLWTYDTYDDVYDVEISSGGYYITAISETAVYLFDWTGVILWSYDTGDYLYKVSFSPDDLYIGALSETTFYIFDWSGELIETELVDIYDLDESIYEYSTANDGSYVAATGTEIYLYDSYGELLWSYDAESYVNSASISSNGLYIASGSDDGRVHFFGYQAPTFIDVAPTATPIPTDYSPSDDIFVYDDNIYDDDFYYFWDAFWDMISLIFWVGVLVLAYLLLRRRHRKVKSEKRTKADDTGSGSGKIKTEEKYDLLEPDIVVPMKSEKQVTSINENEYYTIISKHSGKCLDVSGKRTENAIDIIQWEYLGGDNQKWRFEPAGDGYFSIISKLSGKCLDVSNFGMGNAVKIIQYDYRGGDNQKWRFEPAGDGYFSIISKLNGKCLDVSGFGREKAAKIILYDYWGGDNQKWRLELAKEMDKARELRHKGYDLEKLMRYEDALDCFSKALDIYPNSARAWSHKGSALYNLERYEESIRCFDEALEINPQYARAWQNKGYSLIKIERYEEAIECHDKALSINPENDKTWNNKGWAFYNLEKYEDASRCFDKAIKINPQNALAWYNKGLILFDQEKYKESLFYFDKALVINPSFEWALSKKIKAEEVLNRISDKTEPQPPSAFTPPPVTPSTFPIELQSMYMDIEYLGKGGFARVFKAKRVSDGKTVAVKIPISLDEATGKSFLKEIKAWEELRHPNIVELYDMNIMPIPYFEMEYVENESLEEVKKPVDVEKAARIVFDITEGLKYAHGRGIIHRDLKPHNILLTDEMIPKITDWGLSKVLAESKTSSVVGFSPVYAAPEQISSKQFGRTDGRTDIWQLGLIFYELACGELPFSGESIAEISNAIINEKPVPPSNLNPEAKEVEGIILRCLEKRMDERYQNVEEVQKAVAGYLKKGYKKSLKESSKERDLTRSRLFCGDLVLISAGLGDYTEALKYLSILKDYAGEDEKEDIENLISELKFRLGQSINPGEELLCKIEVLVQRVKIR